MVDVEFGEECRLRFLAYCELARVSPYHFQKREYAEKAWAQVDAFLDWRDINGL